MKPLIWKEFRENVKWGALPALIILLPMLLFGGPDKPMFPMGAAFLFYLIASAFGAALGFLQIYFESRGDHRAILLHRPLGRSRIFLSKVIAGLGIYLLALGVPFVGVEIWMATPGNMPAPYHWKTSLPWLGDILAGVVYYFVGMLTAQREARWYGSRGLGLGAALFCTFLVWTVPEFWQALAFIVLVGTFVGVAAWGSFLAGGAYAPQPRLAKVALAGTLLVGLLVVSVVGKLTLAQWLDSKETSSSYTLDRQGRVLNVPWKNGIGPIEPITDLEGRVPPDLQGRRVDRNLIEEIEAPRASLDWPTFRGYRVPGRFYVQHFNESTPSNEVWYYVPDQGRVLGYDEVFHQFLGSFGPDGFVPAGQPPGERFQGELRYPTRFWDAVPTRFLMFSDVVYDVDFARRTIRQLFTAPEGETIVWANHWRDRREKRGLVVVSTDLSVHVLTEAGAPVVRAPRAYDRSNHRLASVVRLEDPERYVVWYGPALFLEPEELRKSRNYLVEYDPTGRELSRWSMPRGADPTASFAAALYGLFTPPAELAIVSAPIFDLRSEARSRLGKDTWLHL